MLKGAGGFVYGFAPPGGVVNLVTKRPTADFEATFGLQYRSSSILRELIDIGGPLDNSGNVKFRFNGVNEQGRLYNGAYNKDQMASLALTGNLTDRLSWSLDGFYQRTRQDNQVNSITFNTATIKVNGVSYGPLTSLAPVNGGFEPGARGTTKFNDVASITGRLNYRIASDWKASIAARFATLDERFPGSLATIFDNRGDYYSTVYNMNRLFKYYVLDATTTGKFTTGAIHHEIVAGLSSLTDQFLYDNPTRNFALGPANNSTPAVLNISNAYVFNIYQNNQPTIIGNPAAQYNNRPPVWTLYQEIHQRAAYISDTASYGPLSVLLGVRYTHYDEDNINPDGSAISTFKYRPFTPIYAVTLELPHAVRAYFSYVQALQDGGIGSATVTNAGASFGPLSSHQYEAGLKSAGRWGNASLAVFRIVQPSEYVDASNTFVRNGTARYQGIEFNTGIKPVAGLDLSASVSYLDAKQISGKPALIGERIPGTTSFQASALAEYELPFLPGVSVLGGIRHSGNALGGAATNTANAFVYPGNTVGDLGASYALDVSGHAVVLRANVQNLTNERYWVPNALGTGISSGEPRTFSVAAQVALNSHRDGAGSQVESAGSGSDGHSYYLGLDAGVALPSTFDAAATNTVSNPAAAPVHNALNVRQRTGWDVDGVVGYDLGRFSAEIEAGFKRHGVGAISYNNAAVPIEVTGQQHAAGAYDGGGRTGVLSVLFNGLFNIGRKGSAWRGFVGGGVGLARISSGEWTLTGGNPPIVIGATATAGTNTDKSVAIPTYFSNDDATALAWQGIVGVRHPVTDWIDLSLKYRYFDVPGLKLRTESGNPIAGKLRSNSVLLGAIFHL